MTAKMTIRPLLLLLFLILQAFSGFCQKSSILNERRDQVDLNANWQFVKDPKNSAMVPSSGTQWQVVNLPHTWNAKDVLDEVPGYYRGAGWYKKSINTDAKWTGKELFLCFNGANQETDVYINGQNAGRHLGGYTRFLIPISRFLNKSGSGNTIAVKVNNRFNENIAPLTADFTFYGGIYRTVSLVAVDPVHFSDAGLGGSGVYISTPFVSKSKGNVKIHGQLINNSPSIRSLILKTVIYDPQGKVVAQANSALGQVAPNQNISFSKAFPSLLNPVLWSPDDPRLYQISAQIIDSKSGAVLDGIRQQTGLRWFRFDANKGFFLNGRPYKLIGVSRHQDFENLGNAVPDSTQVKDIQMLKKMGGNFLRVAHYPQDQSILDACDRLGILASVEIPIVNEITETKAFADNGKRMLLEMINQNYNHPSIVVWGYMNEILLKMKFKDDEDRQKSYIKNIVNLASALNKAAREADPYRYTMIANHGSTKVYQDAGLTKIPMLVGWNLYNGWYGGKLSEFADNLDKIHKEMPDKPFMVTEYGADADQRIHALAPERFDKSIEYAVQFHQYYLNAIKKRPFVSGAQAWNLADFGAEDREETMPHMNTKGLMTQGRKPKNVFYLYNAYLSHTPYLKIGTAIHDLRTGNAEEGDIFDRQSVQVFTNLENAELFLNGRSLGVKHAVSHLLNWDVPFRNGVNKLHVVSTHKNVKIEDNTDVNFILQPRSLKSTRLPFREISINLGDKRYVTDDAHHQIWVPDQPYRAGSWGYVGGEDFKMEDSHRQPFGIDKDIIGTSLDPIFQTQRIDLEEYRLDVPKGKYEVNLHFAELVGAENKTSLVYNLMNKVFKTKTEKRIFSVYLDHALVVNRLDLTKQYGKARAVSKKFIVTIRRDDGIRLYFKAIEGRAALNAINVKKIN